MAYDVAVNGTEKGAAGMPGTLNSPAGRNVVGMKNVFLVIAIAAVK